MKKSGGLFASAETEDGGREGDLGVVVRFYQCGDAQEKSGCVCYYSDLLRAEISVLEEGSNGALIDRRSIN